jgi:PAS domain S-box-containing protein
MARNITPTNNEVVLNSTDFIVSKTNSKGIITYCNQIFMKMAEYSEAELIGTNHNIIRHPDMPKVAFKVVWDLIQSGKEFFGFVKNLRKNGGYYWVFTNITPDYDQNGNIIGYTSIRRKANPEALNTIIPLYKQLVSIEQSQGINGSLEAINNLLKEKNMEYNELIIALQGDY